MARCSHSQVLSLSTIRQIGRVKAAILRKIPFAAGDERSTALWLWVAGVALGYAGSHAINTEPFARLSFNASVGTMSAAFGLARAGSLAAVVVSWRSDKIGRKSTFIAMFAAAMTLHAATAATPSLWAYATIQALARLSTTAAVIIGTVIAVESMNVRTRPYGVALFGAAVSLGAGTGTAALSVADAAPNAWRWLFTSSLLGLIAVPTLIRRLPDRRPSSRSEGGWYPRIPRRADFWGLATTSFTLAVFSAVSISFAAEYLIGSLETSAAVAAGTLLIGGTIGGLGFIIGSHLSNRLGRKATAAVGIVTSTVGGVMLYRVDSIALVIVATTLSGFGSFVLVPAFGVLRNEAFTSGIRTRAVTWVNNAGVTGSAVGLIIGSVAIDRYGLATTVAVLAAGPVIGLLALLTIRETQRNPLAETPPLVG